MTSRSPFSGGEIEESPKNIINESPKHIPGRTCGKGQQFQGLARSRCSRWGQGLKEGYPACPPFAKLALRGSVWPTMREERGGT